MTVSIEDAKAAIRRDAQARRDALPPDMRAAAAQAIATRPFPVAVSPGMIVSGFMPLKSEINPLPLLRALADAGARLALPVVAALNAAAERIEDITRRLNQTVGDAGVPMG